MHEWSETADPLFCVHGGFDFARTYDVFAPKLAEAGWRVIAWDQRGHGDGAHAALYSWDGDLRDRDGGDERSQRPAPVISHSKGGSLMIQLADAEPFRFSHLINLDGIPYKRAIPGASEHERTRMAASEITGWLDHRRRTATSERKPGTLDELARRRGRMNPRLSFEWLCHLVTVGAFEHEDGWRWKIDPSMRFGGFGPWRPEWTITRLPDCRCPSSASSDASRRRWGGARCRTTCTRTCPRAVAARCWTTSPLRPHRAARPRGRDGARLPGRCVVTGAGSHRIAMLTHNKVQLALHELRGGTGRSLLLLHGLGEQSPLPCRPGPTRGRDRCTPSTSPATAGRPCRTAVATTPRSCSPARMPRSPTWAR
ncbi:MAG: alpha/beta fold hydrolase [Ilumatobacteraceae bacterium]